MVKKLVGVFDDKRAAMQAREDLTVSGFSANQLEVIEQPGGAGENRGVWDKIKDFFNPGEEEAYQEATRRGHVLLAITADDNRLGLAEDILERHHPVDIDEKSAGWRAQGWSPGSSMTEQKIPLVEEELRIGKRTIRGGGVRVHSRITSHPVEEEVELHEEKVQLERRPASRPAGADAFKEQTMEASEMREEAVVGKEARVVEEVVLGKQSQDRTHMVRETLRKTEVDIERLDAEYQRNFQQRYAGKNYEQYQPAYQLGSSLAESPEFEGQPWHLVSSRAQLHAEQRYPGRWNDYRDAIQFGYEERLRGVTPKKL